MQERINFAAISPQALKAMRDLEMHVRSSGIERVLLELVKTRVSQINGCTYCIDMHTQDARAAGDSEQRLHALVAWQDTPFFTERERAALAWAEALTRISIARVPESLMEETLRYFSSAELVSLTFAIIAINGWNRLAIASKMPAGSYRLGEFG